MNSQVQKVTLNNYSLTFHYITYCTENASTGDSEELCEVPFQVQIKYTSLDGQQCLRVFTEVRPVTSDKEVANEGIAIQHFIY